MPPDETLITLEGAALRKAGNSRAVRRNGPSTLVANVSSNPSSVCIRSAGSTPALLTRTSSFDSDDTNTDANSRTEPRLDTSQRCRSIEVEPEASLIRANASSPRSRLRTTMWTLAPPRASSVQAASPIPALPPVTTTDLPLTSIWPRGTSRSRRRYPMDE